MKKDQNGFSTVEILVIIVVIGLLGAVGFFVYDRQKSNSGDTAAGNIVSTNSTQNRAETTDKAVATPTLDEQVLAALKAYCNANVDPTTRQPFVLTVGKSGKNQKQVLYSSDKKFASVNAVCSSDGTTDGSGSAYYFKNVNGSWVFLYNGQMENTKYKEQFDIPSDFN